VEALREQVVEALADGSPANPTTTATTANAGVATTSG